MSSPPDGVVVTNGRLRSDAEELVASPGRVIRGEIRSTRELDGVVRVTDRGEIIVDDRFTLPAGADGSVAEPIGLPMLLLTSDPMLLLGDEEMPPPIGELGLCVLIALSVEF